MNDAQIEQMAKAAFEFDWPKDKWERLGPGYHQDRYKGMIRAAVRAAPASAAEPVNNEAREIIAEFVRLADMGYEDSLKEPEEKGNFAAYERAKRYLVLTIDN